MPIVEAEQMRRAANALDAAEAGDLVAPHAEAEGDAEARPGERERAARPRTACRRGGAAARRGGCRRSARRHWRRAACGFARAPCDLSRDGSAPGSLRRFLRPPHSAAPCRRARPCRHPLDLLCNACHSTALRAAFEVDLQRLFHSMEGGIRSYRTFGTYSCTHSPPSVHKTHRTRCRTMRQATA